jgi:hypothetical protein
MTLYLRARIAAHGDNKHLRHNGAASTRNTAAANA